MCDTPNSVQEETEQPITVLHGLTAVAISAAICHVADLTARAFALTGMSIPIATAITVGLATAFPRVLGPLVASAEGLAAILMQVWHRIRHRLHIDWLHCAHRRIFIAVSRVGFTGWNVYQS